MLKEPATQAEVAQKELTEGPAGDRPVFLGGSRGPRPRPPDPMAVVRRVRGLVDAFRARLRTPRRPALRPRRKSIPSVRRSRVA